MNLKEIWGQNIEVVIKNFTPEIEKSLGKQVLKNHIKKKQNNPRLCPPIPGGGLRAIDWQPCWHPKTGKKKSPKTSRFVFFSQIFEMKIPNPSTTAILSHFMTPFRSSLASNGCKNCTTTESQAADQLGAAGWKTNAGWLVSPPRGGGGRMGSSLRPIWPWQSLGLGLYRREPFLCASLGRGQAVKEITLLAHNHNSPQP